MCYWSTSEVKDKKLKIHYERENKGNQSKMQLRSQAKNTKQKEEKYRSANKIKDVRIMKRNNNTNIQ